MSEMMRPLVEGIAETASHLVQRQAVLYDHLNSGVPGAEVHVAVLPDISCCCGSCLEA